MSTINRKTRRPAIRAPQAFHCDTVTGQALTPADFAAYKALGLTVYYESDLTVSIPGPLVINAASTATTLSLSGTSNGDSQLEARLIGGNLSTGGVDADLGGAFGGLEVASVAAAQLLVSEGQPQSVDWTLALNLPGDGYYSISVTDTYDEYSYNSSDGIPPPDITLGQLDAAIAENDVLLVDRTVPTVDIESTGSVETYRLNQLITGTVESSYESFVVGTAVELTDNGVEVGSATVASDGSWSIDVSLGIGTNLLQADDTDIAENIGTSSPVSYDVEPSSVSSGQIQNGLTLNGGDTTTITVGGEAIGTIINSGGTENVDGGLDEGATINPYGLQTISGHGTSISAVVERAANQDVADGSTVSTTIEGIGHQTILQGGVSIATFLDGMTHGEAFENVSSGGLASGTVVNSWAGETISSGGLAVSTVVSGGYLAINGGESTGSLVGNNGQEEVYYGGAAIGTVLEDGGYQSLEDVSSATDTIIQSGGVQDVMSGGSARETTVYSGGQEDVYNGGLSVDATVYGYEVIQGGVDSGATIETGGEADTVTAGSFSDAIVESGGLVSIEKTGTGLDIGVESGGTISDNGQLLFDNAGLLTESGVISGSGSVTMSGPGLVVLSGGNSFSGGIFLDNGTLEIAPPNGSGFLVTAAGDGPITFVGSAQLTVDDADELTVYNIISGFAPGDAIDLPDLPYSNTGFAYIEPGNMLFIYEDEKEEFLQLDPHQDLSGVGLKISEEASGTGTLITNESGSIKDITLDDRTTSDTVLSGGDSLTLLYGGVATDTTVISGGLQLVEEDGIAQSTYVYNGGRQLISAVGTAENTTVYNGGLVDIFGRAVIGSTVFNDGEEIVDSGYTADGLNLTLSGLDILVVASGGTVADVDVGSGATEVVSVGGVADAARIESNGTVSGYGLLEGVVVSGGGSFVLYGTAAGTALGGGSDESDEYISGGSDSNALINQNGAQYVAVGSAYSATINLGGTQDLLSGGSSIDTLLDGGKQTIQRGGVASGTVVEGGATQTVDGGQEGFDLASFSVTFADDGGEALSTTVSSGGTQLLEGGSVDNVDFALASSGQDASLLATLGEYAPTPPGAVSSDTTVNNGGTEIVGSGGLSYGTTILSGGVIDIFGGGVASGTTFSGGSEIVDTDFDAFNSTVDSSGLAKLTVASGGSSVNIDVRDGGLAIVSRGGGATGTVVDDGGYVATYGTVVATRVSGGGALYLEYGNASGTTLSGTLESSAYEYILGVDSGAAVGSGGSQDVVGSAIDAIVGTGGYQHIEGSASGTTVDGGRQDIVGSATDTTVDAGGVQNVNGGFLTFDVPDQEIEGVQSGAVAINTIIDNGGIQTVAAGSVYNNYSSIYIEPGDPYSVTSLPVYSGAAPGGVASGTTINSGGKQFVSGVANDTTIDDGGQEYIYGQDVNAFVNEGGFQYVEAGGTASETVIDEPGVQIVSSGGVVDGVTIDYGEQDIYGSASASVIEAGGVERVFSGGSTSDTTIAGGTLALEGGAIASEAITFASAGSVLEIDSLADSVSPISDFSVGGSSALINVSPGDVLELPVSAIESVSLTSTSLAVTADVGTTTEYFDFGNVIYGDQIPTGYTVGNDAASGMEAITLTSTNSGFVPPPASLTGTIYDWGSHADLSLVELSTTTGAIPAGSTATQLDFRSVTTDDTGHVIAELYAENPGGAESLNLGMVLPSGVSTSFAASGALPGGWSVVANTNTAGSFSLTGVGSVPLSGAVDIGTISWTIPSGSTSLEFGVASDTLGTQSAAPFALTYASTTSDTMGRFAIADLAAGQYNLSALRTTSDSGRAVTAADALAALKLAVGLNPNPVSAVTGTAPLVSPYQFMAADVNGDGRVTAADALSILKMAVGLSSAPAEKWEFVSDETSYWNTATNSFSVNRTDVPIVSATPIGSTSSSTDMVGILLGDVNGSWVPSTGTYSNQGQSYFTALSEETGAPIDQWGGTSYTAVGAIAAAPSASLPLSVIDSAANVSANLDGLDQLAQAGQLAGIWLNNIGTTSLPVTSAQITADAGAIADIHGSYTLTAAAAQSSALAFVQRSQITSGPDVSVSDVADPDTTQSFAAVGVSPMSSPFYITTSQSGTSFQVVVYAVAGTDAESADLTVSSTNATLSNATGPTGWVVQTNPTEGTVSLFDGTFDSPVGAASDGVLVTLNLVLPSAATVPSGTVTVNDYSDINGTNYGASPPDQFSGGAPCFAAGSRVLTARGAVAVEQLVVGDLAVLTDGRTAPICWIGHRTVRCRHHPQAQDVWPVRIHVGAFGEGLPARDLFLSPDHAVFIDGVLIPIRYLINGATIVQESRDQVTYLHVELERHDVIMAEGLACESYLDTGNRSAFANGGLEVQLHADFALRIWEKEACAPLVFNGAELEAARSYLLDRAERLGYAMTNDPALHLVVGGRPVQAQVSGRHHRFTLPPQVDSIRLVSRNAAPAHVRDDSDDYRRLGVAVSQIRLDGQDVFLADARLGSGWHDHEAQIGGTGWRWTDGDAGIALSTGLVLEIEVAMTARYWLERPAVPAGQQAAA